MTCNDNILIIPPESKERFCLYGSERLLESILLAGISDYLAPGYLVRRINPEHNTLLLCRGGKLFFRNRRMSGKLHPGETLFLPSGELQEYFCREPSTMSWFHFSAENGFHFSRTAFHRRSRSGDELHHLLELIIALENAGRAGRRYGANTGSIAVHLGELLKKYLSGELNADGDFFAPLRKYGKLDQVFERAAGEPDKNWTAEKLARSAGLSISRFFVLCNELYHDTPMGKLRAIRLEHGQRLLISTNLDLEAIAAATGYSSGGAFANAFRKHFKLSPRSFRKKMR